MYSKDRKRYIAKQYNLENDYHKENFEKETKIYSLINKDPILKENMIKIKDILKI